MSAAFLVPPSDEIASNENLTTDFSYQFTPAQVPSGIELHSFTDSACTHVSTGTLNYTLAPALGTLTVKGLRYSKAEDIYLGLSASGMVHFCSSMIRVASSRPALFHVTGPSVANSRLGTAGEVLFTPFTFRISDSLNQPVQNARIRYGTQESAASDANGVTLLQITLGTEERDYQLNPDPTSPYVFNLDFQGVPVHEVRVADNAFDLGSPLYVLAAVGDSVETESGPAATAFWFAALDQYDNCLDPSKYAAVKYCDYDYRWLQRFRCYRCRPLYRLHDRAWTECEWHWKRLCENDS